MTCALCGKAGSYATVCTQCSITLNGQSFIDAVEAMQKALQRVMDMQAAKHPWTSPPMYFTPEHFESRLVEAVVSRYGNVPVTLRCLYIENDLAVKISSEETHISTVRVSPSMYNDDYERLEEAVLAEIYTLVELEDEDDDT